MFVVVLLFSLVVISPTLSFLRHRYVKKTMFKTTKYLYREMQGYSEIVKNAVKVVYQVENVYFLEDCEPVAGTIIIDKYRDLINALVAEFRRRWLKCGCK